MLEQIIEILRGNRGLVVDRMVARLCLTVPRYAVADSVVVRKNVDVLFDDFMSVLVQGDSPVLEEKLTKICDERVSQGFAGSDFVSAALAVGPVVRDFLREATPDATRGAPTEAASLENALQRIAAASVNTYVEVSSRTLEAKNRELNRLVHELESREQALAFSAKGQAKALFAASQFSGRVIQALSSGVMALETGTLKISLWSRRMEELLGLPAEKVIGKNVLEALAKVRGLDVSALVEAVRTAGRLPLTKLRVTSPSGRPLTLFVRGERLYDQDGGVEGTVVIADDVTEREMLLDSFSRYVSRDVVQRLLARATPMGLEGERTVCSVLFADIRGFTGLAEKISPEALHEVLNGYFRVLIDSIVGNGGIIDKFVGDKVMAVFRGTGGAAASATLATQAAVEIKRHLEVHSRRRVAKGLPPVMVGIGVNTGEVLLGNIGSEERMDFTVIGDAVNVADRLQALARAGEIFLGEETARLVRERFTLVDRGLHEVRGRSAKVHVYEVSIAGATASA